MTRAVLVPGVLALLPEYAGLDDPVVRLRTVCLDAVGWLAEAGPVEVVGSPQGQRVARHLLAVAGGSEGPGGALLVVGNGSARRTERAPGHLDERAATFDDALGLALREGDAATLAEIDPDLARELWADTAHLSRLAGLGPASSVDHDDDPFGVHYWVIRWDTP